MARALALFVLIASISVAAPALAEDPHPVAQPQPPPQQPPPPQAQPTPPPGYGQPGASGVVVVEQPAYGAPAYGTPGYGAPAGYGYAYQDPREAQYQSMRKSVWLAVLFDAVLPGVGNIYAGAIMYSLITWGGLIVGMTMMVSGLSSGSYDADTGTYSSTENGTLMGVGALVFFGSYIFGVVTAGTNAASYNGELRAQLGLPVALGPTPDLAGGALSVRTVF